MNIDTMPAGREMDALVAEKVMGCKAVVEEHADPPRGPFKTYSCMCKTVPDHYLAACTPYPHPHSKYEGTREIKEYSSRIGPAWEVVEQLNSDHWDYAVHVVIERHAPDDTHEYEVYIRQFGGETWEAEAGSAPLAICRAALKVVGL